MKHILTHLPSQSNELPVVNRRDRLPSGIAILHLEPPAGPVTLTPDSVVRVAQLARLIPAAWQCQEEILGLRSIATELRLMVGWPADDPLMPVKD